MGSRKQKQSTKMRNGAVLELKPRTVETCTKGHCHYWIIESPKGPTSKGICRFCGTIQEFDNFGPDFRWYGDTPELLVPSLPDLTINKEK